MKFGSNFDTKFYKQRLEYNKKNYGDNFIISRYHWVYLFKIISKIILLFLFILTFLFILIYTNIIIIHYGFIFLSISIIFLILKIFWELIKYKNTFFIFNKDEIVLNIQKSIFRRDIKVIPTINIRAINVITKSITGTFLQFGSIEIIFDNNSFFEIDYFKKIQEKQSKIREIVFKKSE